jgi:hypothetical protein
MEWPLLFLLVPAIVAAVVLLIGFAGCGFETTIHNDPQPPTLVSAIPFDGQTVELKWTDTNSGFGPLTFEIERTIAAQSPSLLTPTVPPPPVGQPHRFVDSFSGAGGTQVTYRVRTVTADGTITGFSQPAAVETWSRAFSSGLAQNGTNAAAPGQCIVQRVSPGSLSHGGNLILVTLRGGTNGDLVVSAATISNPALAGENFDSDATPVPLALTTVFVTAGQTLPLQPTEFKVNVADPLLIAFDVDNPGNGRLQTGVTHTAYVKMPPLGGKVTEAATQNRAGFTEQSNRLWLVDAVDVATKWPPIP